MVVSCEPWICMNAKRYLECILQRRIANVAIKTVHFLRKLSRAQVGYALEVQLTTWRHALHCMMGYYTEITGCFVCTSERQTK